MKLWPDKPLPWLDPIKNPPSKLEMKIETFLNSALEFTVVKIVPRYLVAYFFWWAMDVYGPWEVIIWTLILTSKITWSPVVRFVKDIPCFLKWCIIGTIIKLCWFLIIFFYF